MRRERSFSLEADADYYMGLVSDQLGVEAFLSEVDGKGTVLDDDYVGGKHTIGIGGLISGEPWPSYRTTSLFKSPGIGRRPRPPLR